MSRRAKIVLLASGTAIAAVALCVVFRAALLEAVLRTALAARGVASVELTVEGVGWREIVISGLALGADGEARARKVVIVYDPRDLLAGRVQAVDVDGLSLALDLTGNAPPLGSLGGLVAGEPGAPGEAAAPAIPPVRLSDARIQALTPLGAISGHFDGSLGPGPDGALEGTLVASLRFELQGEAGRLRGAFEATRAPNQKLDARLTLEDGALALPGAELRGLRGAGTFSALGAEPVAAALRLTLAEIALPGAAFERARVALRLAARRLDAEASLATADGQFSLRVDAGFDDVLSNPAGQVRLEADIGAAAVLWPLLALPAPAKGRVQATLVAQGRLPPFAALPGADVKSLLRLLSDDFAGQALLRLNDIDYPGVVRGLSGEVRLDSRPESRSADTVAGTMRIDLTAARAGHADFRASRVALKQTLLIKIENEILSATIGEPGKISTDEFSYASILASGGPLSARIETGAAQVDFNGSRGPVLAHDITLAPAEIPIRLPRRGRADLPLALRARELRATGEYRAAKGYAGRVRIADGQVSLPDRALAAEGLNATLDLTRDGRIQALYDVGALRHTSDPPAVAPFSLRGEAEMIDGMLDFSATGADRSGAAALTLTGRHDAGSGKGGARFGLAPLTFVPGGVQPSTLFPPLAELRDVTGQARAEAEVSWGPKAFSGAAALQLDDISLDSAAARVEGLSLELKLDQLRPPGSAPGQVLRIRRIESGAPIDDLLVRFQVLPRESPALGIAEAGFLFAGGRFFLADVVADPGKDQLHLPIQVEGLDLAEVFDLIGVDDVSGDGRLSGTIPLSVTDGVPAIAKGRLAAQGPGRLRVQSDYVRQALAAAGDSAELLLRALEDFHYQELNLNIDQPSPTQVLVGLSMLGSNPAVLDGHPFRFNVNLETDPGKLLAVLRDAYRISDRAIRQMWMFGR